MVCTISRAMFGSGVLINMMNDIFKIKKIYGTDYAQEFWKSSVDAIDLLEMVIQENQIDCDWERKGHCALAYKQSHFDELPDYVNWLKKNWLMKFV